MQFLMCLVLSLVGGVLILEACFRLARFVSDRLRFDVEAAPAAVLTRCFDV